MITNEQIRQIIDRSAEKGYNVNVRDISFIILADAFDDSMVAYKSLFGNDKDFDPNYLQTYVKTGSMEFLAIYVPTFLDKDDAKNDKKTSFQDITFDENKAEIIKLIEKTQREEANGKVDAEKSLRIQADLRCKLNDKFKVQEENREQMIIVNTKYTGVCEFCGHEIEQMTKETAMKKFNLIEKD